VKGQQHSHVFGQDVPREGERRTLTVVVITAVTMAVEIAAGLAFGSMALLADGLHMGSHASALFISVFAYRYTRRHAADPGFAFGTGKVNELAAFASAVLLVVFALFMGFESVRRLVSPVTIRFDLAILVAVLGLLVNGACLFVLRVRERGRREYDRPAHGGHDDHDDHNLVSAYIHVLADALTSVLAIGALLAGRYAGLVWLDPLMGIVGALLIANWSRGLLGLSAGVLLDRQAPAPVRNAVRTAIEGHGDDRIADLHIWSVGPGIRAAEIVVVSSAPEDPARYRERLPRDLGLVHVTIEVRMSAPDSGR